MPVVNTKWSNVLGMICVGFAEFLSSTEDAITKLSKLPVSQLMAARYVFQLIIGIIWWIGLKYKDNGNKLGHWYGNQPYIRTIWLYGMIQFIDVFCFWYGIRLIPMGLSISIITSSHFIIVFIAYLYLKEPLFKTFIPTVLMVIVALFFVVQPTFLFESFAAITNETFHSLSILGLVLVTVSTFAYSASCILLRTTSKINEDGEEEDGAHFLQLQITNSFQNIFIYTPYIMIINTLTIHDEFVGDITDIQQDWKWDLYSLIMLFLAGLIGFGALTLNILGYQLGDATKVVWFENCDLISSYCYQILLFGNMPNTFEISGALLMFIAGFVPLMEEIYKMYFNGITYIYCRIEGGDETTPGGTADEFDGDPHQTPTFPQDTPQSLSDLI